MQLIRDPGQRNKLTGSQVIGHLEFGEQKFYKDSLITFKIQSFLHVDTPVIFIYLFIFNFVHKKEILKKQKKHDKVHNDF